MSRGSHVIGAGLLAAVVGTSGASAEDVMLEVTGSREVGHEVISRLPSGPAIGRLGLSADGEAPTLLASDGTACICRAVPASTDTPMAALVLDKQANVTGELPGRQLQPRSVLNNNGHAVSAASYRQGAFTVEHSLFTRLRVTIAR